MNLPLWTCLPFALVLLSIAFLPSLAPRFFKRYMTLLLMVLSVPVLIMSASIDFQWVMDTFSEYVTFICLLAALYVIGGGLFVSGTPKANPLTNMGFLAFGAIIANLIGTLGASMILIRPLIRSNRGRRHQGHVVIFFIFIVSNAGGLLTPLGDPPLLIGNLLGVPFWWTLKLFPVWIFMVSTLLAAFLALDSYFYIRDPDFRGPLQTELKEPLHITGRWNLALIPLVIAALTVPQRLLETLPMWSLFLRTALLLSVVYISRKITPKLVHHLNEFSWGPLEEVAIIFAAIFATMIPAVKVLETHSSSFGISSPFHFFWISGLTSALLDNAPTYAAFFAVAKGLGKDIVSLRLMNGSSISEPLLMAISCGSVFFGALTYIGNGPNLIVRSIAEENDVVMPSYFSYILWSISFVLPVLVLCSILFFEYT